MIHWPRDFGDNGIQCTCMDDPDGPLVTWYADREQWWEHARHAIEIEHMEGWQTGFDIGRAHGEFIATADRLDRLLAAVTAVARAFNAQPEHCPCGLCDANRELCAAWRDYQAAVGE